MKTESNYDNLVFLVNDCREKMKKPLQLKKLTFKFAGTEMVVENVTVKDITDDFFVVEAYNVMKIDKGALINYEARPYLVK